MKPVIIKFTRNHQMNDSEYESLKDIIAFSEKTDNANNFFAATYCKGKAYINDKALYKKKELATFEEINETKIWSYIV
jgi:uncharacterized protein YxeA